MPQVGGTEFPYTPSGMRKAERYAKKNRTGLSIDNNIYGDSNKKTMSKPSVPNAKMRKRRNPSRMKPYKMSKSLGPKNKY